MDNRAFPSITFKEINYEIPSKALKARYVFFFLLIPHYSSLTNNNIINIL